MYGVYEHMCVSARMKDIGGIHEGGIHKCTGACGKANCTYETTRMSHYKRHVRKIRQVRKKKKCPHCGKIKTSGHTRLNVYTLKSIMKKISRVRFQKTNTSGLL